MWSPGAPLARGIRVLLRSVVTVYNVIVLTRRRRTATIRGPMPTALDEIKQLAAKPTDISSHLERLYETAIEVSPNVIVELGVRTGASTFALGRAAETVGAYLISVDIEDCSSVSDYERWIFVQADDVELGNGFRSWAQSNGLPQSVDVLFIDTSHLLNHTRAELAAWRPHLSSRGVMMLHDTNLRTIYRRSDGTLGVGWNNRRGVIQALEEEFGFELDETKPARLKTDGWVLDHWPECNGLTVMRRM